MKLMMEVVPFQNKALTSQMVLAMEDILEGQWLRSNDLERRESVEELMSFILISFGAGYEGRTSHWFLCVDSSIFGTKLG